MKKYYARYMLYNLSFDIKRMLDENIDTKKVYDQVVAKLERDFKNNSWKRIIWKDKSKKYVEKPKEFYDVEEHTRIKDEEDEEKEDDGLWLN